MCGILGGTYKDWDYSSSLASLYHRGPDSQRLLELNEITLGFTRLSLIDLSDRANQPMSDPITKIHMVFNGEIYGYQSVRARLEGLGHRFHTQSDSEVLLRSYIQWRERWTEYLDGMFAVAFYDQNSGAVQLFRDRVGIKPLYYLVHSSQFAFASELKAIVRLCGNNHLQIDHTALYDYFTYKYIPSPKTLYRYTRKLTPATFITYDVRNRKLIQERKYWSVPDSPGNIMIDPISAKKRTLEILTESTSKQLIADAPVGVLLSGGLDSSSVAAACANMKSDLMGFSIGFDDAKHSELSYARRVAKCLSISHFEETLSLSQTAKLLCRMENWFDEPFADTSAIPTSLVSQLASTKVKAVLSGDGGDEIFGGYRWYQRFKLLQALSPLRTSLPRKLMRLLLNLPLHSRTLARGTSILHSSLFDDFCLYADLMGGLMGKEKLRIRHSLGIKEDYDDYWKFRDHWRPDLPVMTRLQYLDFHTYLPDDILTKVDRVSMANSLEVRVPFLCRRLIEFCFQLNEKCRFPSTTPKGLLKAAMKEHLPKEILNRSKKGFSIPPSHTTGSSDYCGSELCTILKTGFQDATKNINIC